MVHVCCNGTAYLGKGTAAVISQLAGTLLEKMSASVVIGVGGVGFDVGVSLYTYDRLPEVGQSVVLHTYLLVREDALSLYGFHDRTEREFFVRLLSVSGIGARMALAVLSGFAPPDLAQAILSGDGRRLSGVPGIGKKTAERIIIELRDKLPAVTLPQPTAPSAVDGDEPLKRDVVSALINFGWSPPVVEKAVAQTLAEETSRELSYLIKQTMKRLYR
ncbi:MAG: Holliday junction branch migration protein RuvA [Chloracidobacterium sp.]|uniref:Holliday junction branch migration complex subunit RuvA n=1 Tax=Chloracidobacterium validum TaxID=2821543 RepID=A0ABX8B6K4_9BACT|nr:Holliday junction branch migration protein RuvA [Chloracidobacterium validum]QUW02266.1 Holliday junction branch migration protein RuvA [Chloracidobacterium validum]